VGVLITGFEPFGGSEVNPSGAAATSFDGEVVSGFRLSSLILPVSWREAAPRLIAGLDRLNPRYVLMLGQGSGSGLDLERVAINCCCGTDNCGEEREDQPVVPGGPDGLFSTLPLRRLAHALQESGIPARISNSAGTYLCNHAMYWALYHLSQKGLAVSAGFVHVPSLPRQVVALKRPAPSMSQDMINQAVDRLLHALLG